MELKDLPAELASFVEHTLASGTYPSAEALVADAVRVLRDQEAGRTARPHTPDGLVHEECWFCGSDVAFRPDERAGSNAAVVFIEPFGAGEPTHGVCHVSCAERAKGSLAR